MWTEARVYLVAILSTGEALHYLGTFVFITSYLLSASERHLPDIVEIIRLVERMNELHTEVQGIFSPSPSHANSLQYIVVV